MMKATYVAKNVNHQLQIQFKGGLLLRFFGALFLLFGGYFLYHLVMGVIDSVRYGQMLLLFPGTCLLVIMMLVFGVPGWLLTLTTKRTVIDPVGREVLDMKDFLIYRQIKRYPIEAFNRVTVSSETRRIKSKDRYKSYQVFPVKLIGANEEMVTAAEMDDRNSAMKLGRQIAAVLDLPLNKANKTKAKTIDKDDFEENEEFAEENEEA